MLAARGLTGLIAQDSLEHMLIFLFLSNAVPSLIHSTLFFKALEILFAFVNRHDKKVV
jgi:hypothetical protein